MNYVTTNIRISEDDYLRLKNEAAQKRVSLSEIIRQQIRSDKYKRSPQEVERIIRDTNKTAKKVGKKLKGFDAVKAIREMRDTRYGNY